MNQLVYEVNLEGDLLFGQEVVQAAELGNFPPKDYHLLRGILENISNRRP